MSRRPRVVFVDHSFHRVTGSSRFFSDILRETSDVVELDCEGWRGGARVSAERIDSLHADRAVFWQTMSSLSDMVRLRTPAVWVPMYDSAAHRPAPYWRVLSHSGIRIVSFCRALSQLARRHGIPVSDYTYYPDPSQFPHVQRGQQDVRVFLWDRGDIGFEQLKKLLGPQRVERTILRAAPDPGRRVSRITPEDMDTYNLRLLVGSMPRAEHLELLSGCNVFLAPRQLEGIGMTFLEAMAMGLAVVAPDRPTMNEYIKHGVNGYLYDPLKPETMDLTAASGIGVRARQTVLEGRREWLASKDGLMTDVFAPRAGTRAPSRSVAATAALLTAAERVTNMLPPRHRSAITRILRSGLRKRS